MSIDKQNKAFEHQDQNRNVAGTGNASNPSPTDQEMEPAGNQLLNEKAEKYLRESGNIEDMPDVNDEEEMDRKV